MFDVTLKLPLQRLGVFFPRRNACHRLDFKLHITGSAPALYGNLAFPFRDT
jgi:hypothetical protein